MITDTPIHTYRVLMWLMLIVSLLIWPGAPERVRAIGLAQAAITINVTTPADQWDTDPATAPSSKCSLREALQATGSNALGNQGCGTINPNAPSFIINLPPGTYLLTRQEELPNTNKKIYINGNNAVTIDGNKGSRAYGIFIVAGGELILEELTLRNGKRPFGGAIWIKSGSVRATAVDLRNNVADNGPQIGRGGAVMVDGGSFECVSCTFSENQARDRGGAVASGNAAVRLDNCEFLRNQAGLNGGAFASTGGSSVTYPFIYQSLFRENFVKQTVIPPGWPAQYQFEDDSSGGGAIHTTAYLRLEQVQFVKNYTDRSKGGGAIYNQGEIEMVDSAITDSKAQAGGPVPATIGGAILNDGTLTIRRSSIHYNEATYGGAILNRTSGQLLIFNSTLAENLARTYGGIANGYNFPLGGGTAYNQGGTVTLLHTTVAMNNDESGDADGSPSIANVNNGTIIMGNALTDAPCVGTITTHGGNLFVKSCTRISSDNNTDYSTADVVAPNNAALKLTGLSNNGGVSLPEAEFLSIKTETSSPAVDLARDAWCNDPALPAAYELSTDQVNVGRPIGPKCDAGGLEVGTNPPSLALFWEENPISKMIAFGLVLLDDLGYSDGNLKIKNEGGGSFNWAVAFEDNTAQVYRILEGPTSGTLGQDQVTTLRLRCAATRLGWQQPARLVLTTDVPGKETVSLLLECKGTTWDEDKEIAFENTQSGPLSVGEAAPGAQAQTQVAISNPGASPLDATLGWQQPVDGSPLAFATTLPALALNGDPQLQAQVSVPPQGRLEVTITCAPTVAGLFANTLLITTSDPLTPLLSYAVSCEGTPPPAPDPLAIATRYQQLPGDQLMGLALSPEGNQLLAGEWGTPDLLRYSIPNSTTGQLAYQGLFSTPGMTTVTGIRYSADGRHVYYSSLNGNGVVALNRGSDGTLSLIDTITADDLRICGVNPTRFCLRNRMRGARALDISPDDATVYVTGINDSTLTVLRRNPTDGKLTVTQSFTSTIAGLADLMSQPFGVKVSPDGRNVYVAARGSDTVIAFSRNPLNGRLSYLGHARDEENAVTGLNGATELNLSPDGTFLYVAGQFDDAVQVFRRNPADGFLTPVEAVSVGDAPYHLLVSKDPDGSRLVVALYTGSALKVFQRNRVSGKLTPLEGQAELPLNQPVFLVASADDQHLYTTLYNGEAVQHLRNARYAPLLQNLAPASLTAGSAATSLTLNGTRFYPDSTVLWNGSPLTTSFVSSRKLEAQVPAALLANAGTVSVTVRTGPIGGGEAPPLALLITAVGTAPLPAIASLSPEAAQASGEALEVTISGSGFTPQSRALLNGNSVATTYVNSSTLLAQLAASDLDAPGPLAISVVNQPEAGSPSLAADAPAAPPLKFAVAPLDSAALPGISHFAPGSLEAGGAEQWLTVKGFNFAAQPGTRTLATWNGAPRETMVLDAQTLQLRLSASDLAAVGSATVVLTTPGIGSSDRRSINLLAPGQNPVARLDTLNLERGAAPQLLISGTGFVTGAQVRLNGVARTTTVINPYVVSAVLSRADLRQGGLVQVINPNTATSNGLLLPPSPTLFVPLVRR